MNRYSNRLIELNLPGIGLWLGLLLLVVAVSSLGFGTLLNWLLVAVLLLLFAPIVVILGFFWWAQRKVVQAPCPVCSFEFAGFNGSDCTCPSCGEPLTIAQQQFVRRTPPGTVDVAVVDMSPPDYDPQLPPGPRDR